MKVFVDANVLIYLNVGISGRTLGTYPKSFEGDWKRGRWFFSSLREGGS